MSIFIVSFFHSRISFLLTSNIQYSVVFSYAMVYTHILIIISFRESKDTLVLLLKTLFVSPFFRDFARSFLWYDSFCSHTCYR